MDTALILFILRLISGLLLIAFLIALLLVMWRDYHSAVTEVHASRRKYGQLVMLREVENQYVLTGDVYPLLPLTSLGRSPTNTIPINDTFASAEHALVTLRNGQWWLEDRQSRNGTLLNGSPVTQATVITEGDMIGIGNSYFRLELER